MNVMNQYISKSEQLQTLMNTLDKDNQNVLLSGVTTSFYAPLLQMIFENKKRPMIIMMQNLYHAQRLYDQLIDLMDMNSVRLFPMDEFITAEMLASSSELRIERMNTLASIIENQNKIVVTHVAGATRFLTPKEIFKQADIQLEVGGTYELDELKRKLVELGYQSVRAVEHMGEFSVRGGILDVFPMTEENQFVLNSLMMKLIQFVIFQQKLNVRLIKLKRQLSFQHLNLFIQTSKLSVLKKY